MSRTEKPKADPVKDSLRDDELDTVTGGGARDRIRIDGIRGETHEKTPSPTSPVPLPYPVLAA